ncbi:MAG TPA: hypothetical protein HA252_00135 [Candidatus Diapherotrites archaeon]|uniref:Elongation factor Tu-type domain-containing protein n=1 Tax=Candidatus Iainarchaeum sp. TaxID=3101447 RepID=A0A7J4JDG2_9ARCH|nr:hypothetical protein [Candidatus Diapherotrites archaeon]HIH15801.1 hypothetical protein [Candidatus Diapherotrites archaeon]
MGIEFRQGETKTWKQLEPEAAPAAAPTGKSAAFEVSGSYMTGQGVVLSGEVVEGTLRKGMSLTLQGRKGKVLEINLGLRSIKAAKAGERVSVLLDRAIGSFVRHGDVLAFGSGK